MGTRIRQGGPASPGAGEPARYRPRVVARFVLSARSRSGDPAAPLFDGDQIKAWEKFSAAFGGLDRKPLFRALERGRIAELVREAHAADHSFKDPGFDSFFEVQYGPNVDPDQLVQSLRAEHDLVMTAYLQGGPGSPPRAVAPAGLLEAEQLYLDPAPDGVGARLLLSEGIPGSDGEGIRFVDIEQGWVLDHVDLPRHPRIPEPTFGVNGRYRGHGTSVLGVVLAQRNQKMCLGIAPKVSAFVVSEFEHVDKNLNLHDALFVAIDRLRRGDVLLIEGQFTDEGSSKPKLEGPVEIQDDVFHLIRLATALGITVIEPAGNGGFDLDTYSDSRAKGLFAPDGPACWRQFRDSGAVMVGASEPGTHGGKKPIPDAPLSHRRWSLSNYGDRVDCFAWGEDVVTLGGSGEGTEDVTDQFSGTSSASAIIAGLAVAIQGMALHKLEKPYTPRQVREILRDPLNGTASANGREDGIGVMPDLRSIASSVIGVLPDVYARDFLGDDGMFHYGPLSASPDLFIRRENVDNPDGQFGEGSGCENQDDLHQGVHGDGGHFVYLRARNRGGAGKVDVDATLYCAPVATLLRVDLWHAIGPVRIEGLPSGNVLRVSAPRRLDPEQYPDEIDENGDTCLIALVGSKGDPAPDRKSLKHWRNFVRYVREENNLAIRNLHDRRVRDDALGDGADSHALEMPFLATGAADVEHSMWFELISSLPEDAGLCLDLTPALADMVETSLDQKAPAATKSSPSPRLTPNGRSRLAPVRIPRGFRERCGLRISLPRTDHPRTCQVFIRQMLGDLEVGRITWRVSQEPASDRNRQGKRKK